MQHVIRPRRLLACGAVALAFALSLISAPAAAQTVNPPIAAGSAPVAVAVNPVTNKIYVANAESDDVTVIDGATHATTTVAAGDNPEFIAVNPLTNRVYVNNGRDSTLTVIDGATDTVIGTLPIGSRGPIAIDTATNRIFVVRLSTLAFDEVTIVDGASNSWYSIATDGFQPVAIALNHVTNKLYVAAYGSGTVRVIDAASSSDHPPSAEVKVWTKPMAVAVNPVTNRIYVLTEDSRGPIAVIDGADNAVTYLTAPGHLGGPRAVAVNPVTNRIYAAFAGEVVVVDGATNAMAFVPSGTAAAGPVAVGINTMTNRVYAPNTNGTLTVIDGASNAPATIAIPAGAHSIGVNPVTNTMYVVASAVSVVDGSPGDPLQAIPLTTTIAPLPGHSSGPDATFTLTASSAFSPTAPAVRKVYYQLDGVDDAWTPAAGTGPFTASFTGLAPGTHTLHAFATDGQDAPAGTTGAQSNPLVGAIASYAFTVAAEPGTLALRYDFNGDRRSDVLWRDPSGLPTFWHLNGASITGGNIEVVSAGNVSVSASFSVVGVGDFNGDGKADILLRNPNSGSNVIWHLDGSVITAGKVKKVSTGSLPSLAADWTVIGTGDFNGDGKSDILWRDPAGVPVLWNINGSSITSGQIQIVSQGTLSLSTGFSVQAIGDFNGDGKADVLWRKESSGSNRIWHLDGAIITSGKVRVLNNSGLQSLANTWIVSGVGDFNGDGKSDLLWRDPAGQGQVWHLNGASLSGGQVQVISTGTVSTAAGFMVAGVGDYNGDGFSDVLFRNPTSGSNRIWHLNGNIITAGKVRVLSAGNIPSVDSSWTAVNTR